MTRVVAFLDESPVAAAVLTTARAVARLLDATVDAIRVTPTTAPPPGHERAGEIRLITGTPESALVAELEAPDVAIGVIGARSLASKPEALGHVATTLILNASTPLVVVPPGARPLSVEGLVFLLPLDGETETTYAAVPIASQLTARLGEVLTLHVFDSSTVPMFITSPHDQEVIASEFLARHSGECSDRMHLRLGHAASEILDVAHQERVGAIVLTWNQDLSPGRAQVIQRLLRESPVPVVLQPGGAERRNRSEEYREPLANPTDPA